MRCGVHTHLVLFRCTAAAVFKNNYTCTTRVQVPHTTHVCELHVCNLGTDLGTDLETDLGTDQYEHVLTVFNHMFTLLCTVPRKKNTVGQFQITCLFNTYWLRFSRIVVGRTASNGVCLFVRPASAFISSVGIYKRHVVGRQS